MQVPSHWANCTIDRAPAVFAELFDACDGASIADGCAPACAEFVEKWYDECLASLQPFIFVAEAQTAKLLRIMQACRPACFPPAGSGRQLTVTAASMFSTTKETAVVNVALKHISQNPLLFCGWKVTFNYDTFDSGFSLQSGAQAAADLLRRPARTDPDVVFGPADYSAIAGSGMIFSRPAVAVVQVITPL